MDNNEQEEFTCLNPELINSLNKKPEEKNEEEKELLTNFVSCYMERAENSTNQFNFDLNDPEDSGFLTFLKPEILKNLHSNVSQHISLDTFVEVNNRYALSSVKDILVRSIIDYWSRLLYYYYQRNDSRPGKHVIDTCFSSKKTSFDGYGCIMPILDAGYDPTGKFKIDFKPTKLCSCADTKSSFIKTLKLPQFNVCLPKKISTKMLLKLLKKKKLLPTFDDSTTDQEKLETLSTHLNIPIDMLQDLRLLPSFSKSASLPTIPLSALQLLSYRPADSYSHVNVDLLIGKCVNNPAIYIYALFYFMCILCLLLFPLYLKNKINKTKKNN